MSSEKNTKNKKDSTTNLMRLFKVQPNNQIVTRQDLVRDYNGETSARSSNSDDDDDDNDDDNNNENDIISINNYYTWNSSRTNASIHKERAAIISALHSAESVPIPSLPLFTSLPQRPSSLSSSSSSWPLASKSFTRSHRVQDIVAMCSDERSAFSTDEYHNESAHSDDWPQSTDTSRPGHSSWSGHWTSDSHLSSSVASTADSSSDSDDKSGRRNEANTAAEATSHQSPKPASPSPRPLSIWKRTFSLFRKK